MAEVEANEAPDKSRALILATATAAQASAIPEKFLGYVGSPCLFVPRRPIARSTLVRLSRFPALLLHHLVGHAPTRHCREETMALIARRNAAQPVPEWHAPWKCMRVISGHTGWVRAVDVDVSNEWFVTGAKDRTIKIWDLASGKLKVYRLLLCCLFVCLFFLLLARGGGPVWLLDAGGWSWNRGWRHQRIRGVGAMIG